MTCPNLLKLSARSFSVALLLAGATALSACGQEAAPPTEEGTADTEVMASEPDAAAAAVEEDAGMAAAAAEAEEVVADVAEEVVADATTEMDPVQVKIARAMSAAPMDVSGEATILDLDGTLLREGTNGWTCYPGVPLIPNDDHPMCNDGVWEAWLAAAKSGTAFSTDIIGTSYMLQGDALVDNMDPTATDPSAGGMWVQEGPHLMMLFPNTDMLKGLPRDPFSGGPYVMWDNTPMVHVMVPVEAKPEE